MSVQENLSQSEVRDILAGKHVPVRRARQNQRVTQLTITIPIPPKATHPNAGGVHWTKKARAKKKQKEAAYYASLEAIDGCRPPFWRKATIQATFYRGGKNDRRADADNLCAWLKASADALQDAGIVMNDSGFTWLPIEQVLGRDAGASRVELVVAESRS